MLIQVKKEVKKKGVREMPKKEVSERSEEVQWKKSRKHQGRVNISVPSDTNIVSKTPEKNGKYRDLQIEISRCWNMNTKVVPIVVGALGTVGKDLSLKLSTLPGLL